MAIAVGVWPRPWGRGKGLGGVAKSVRAIPNPNPKVVGRSQRSGGMAKAVGAWPRPWRCCQGRRGVAKVVSAWPRTWRRGQGRECGTKAVG